MTLAKRPARRLALAAALLAGVGRADGPPPGGAAPEIPLEDRYRAPFWSTAYETFAKSDAGFEKASEEALRRSRDIWDTGLLRRMRAAEQAPKLARIGSAATQVGRAGAYSGILGAWAGGDRAGMAQEATNAFLGDVAAGIAAAGAIALLPATATMGAVIAAGVAGAVLASTAYDELVKPRVNAVFAAGVEFSQDVDAMNQRIARARIWVGQADVACADARRALADARRAAGEAGTAEETVRWLDDESTRVEARMASARELAARARASASPAELAAENAATAELGEARAADAAGYADEACRIAGEMAGTRQPDALRIWNRADHYLDRRASSVAADAAGALEEARERTARVEEINALRRDAASALAQAESEVTALDAQVAGARGRLDLVATQVRRAAGLLQEATATTEDCNALENRAVALLNKAPWNEHAVVRRVLEQEVLPIEPPFRELEAVADAIPEAETAVARARRQFDWIAATVADLRREAATLPPAPDPGAAERARSAVGRAEAASAQAEGDASRASGCAERARGLAQSEPGEGERPAPEGGEAGERSAERGGGWERVGGVETVGGGAAPGVPQVPAGPTVEDLLGDAETAYGACNFAAARAAVARARALAPGDPYVAEVAARVEDKAKRQAAAIAALQSAEQALGRGARKETLAALDRAADAAPDCFTQQVAAVSGQVRGGLASQREEANQQARSAIGGLVGTMIGAWNAGTAASEGGSRAPGGSLGSTPAESTADDGASATGSYCSINGAPGTADLFLLFRQRPQANVDNYVIVATTAEDAPAASAVPGMELVSRHERYADAVAAARRACPNPVQGSY